jgi:hypothetical protein
VEDVEDVQGREAEIGWGEWPNDASGWLGDGGSAVGGASGSREGEACVSGGGSGSRGVRGSSRVRKPRKTSWVPPPKEPVNKVEIISTGDEQEHLCFVLMSYTLRINNYFLNLTIVLVLLRLGWIVVSLAKIV